MPAPATRRRRTTVSVAFSCTVRASGASTQVAAKWSGCSSASGTSATPSTVSRQVESTRVSAKNRPCGVLDGAGSMSPAGPETANVAPSRTETSATD